MALSVKRVTLWRADVDNQPGVLARTLEPLAAAGGSLRVVMGYRLPEMHERAVIELHPVTGKRQAEAAERAGLTAATIPCLLVEGEDRPGLGAAMARALADARVNIAFLMAQVVGRRFSALVGFDDEAAIGAGARAVKAAVRPTAGTPRRPARKTRRRR